MNQSGAFPECLASKDTGSSGARRRNRADAGPGKDSLPQVPRRRSGARPTPESLTKLARWLLAGEVDTFRAEIHARVAAGDPPLQVMNDVLSPVARELGRFWDNDECDLIDVQRSAGVLKRVIDEVSPHVVAQAPAKRPSLLLQVAPGERHTLGVRMAEAAFCGMGWRVTRGEPSGYKAELAQEWRDFVGFSLSCDRHVEALVQAIAEARAVSRNPGLLVVVGGPLFLQHPGLAQGVGADFCVCAVDKPVQPQDALLNGRPRHTVFTSAAEIGSGRQEQE